MPRGSECLTLDFVPFKCVSLCAAFQPRGHVALALDGVTFLSLVVGWSSFLSFLLVSNTAVNVAMCGGTVLAPPQFCLRHFRRRPR